MMTEAIKGKSRTDAVHLYEKVHKLVTGEDLSVAKDKDLGSLRALGGVSKFPMRVKCASLAWHAMKAALDGTSVVSTEGPDDARSAS
jgi:nitrogen fixation NifU-like protein